METYVLVTWPDSQEYMDEAWFQDKAHLADEEKVGSSAYFIPESRIITNPEFEEVKRNKIKD